MENTENQFDSGEQKVSLQKILINVRIVAIYVVFIFYNLVDEGNWQLKKKKKSLEIGAEFRCHLTSRLLRPKLFSDRQMLLYLHSLLNKRMKWL